MKLVTPAPVASRGRSAVKMVTWRAVAALDTFVISYLVTGNSAWAGSIVGIEAVSKMLFYYLHERGWAHIAWGSAAEPSR